METKPTDKADKFRRVPFVSREEHYRRVDELLKSNNLYLQRARDAEARADEAVNQATNVLEMLNSQAQHYAAVIESQQDQIDDLVESQYVYAELKSTVPFWRRLFGRSAEKVE